MIYTLDDLFKKTGYKNIDIANDINVVRSYITHLRRRNRTPSLLVSLELNELFGKAIVNFEDLLSLQQSSIFEDFKKRIHK